MTINKIVEQDVTTLQVEGWLDTNSSSELGKAIKETVDTPSLILDFSKLEYISSSGLREVISAYKYTKGKGGTFSVIHVGREVMDVFRLTGFDTKLDIQCDA